MTDYSTLSYWDRRYTDEHLEIFEWYQTFDTLHEKIIEYFKPTDKILHVGCGTSKFAEDIISEGFEDVMNIDFSDAAIQMMLAQYQDENAAKIMKYKKMDVLDMSEFADKSYNVVFDKALLDTILCGENAIETVGKMMNEIYRVLADDGYYIIVSNANEENRKNLFDVEKWEYKVMEIEKQSKMINIGGDDDKDPKNYHYIYVLNKKIVEPPKEVVVEEPKEEKKEEKKETKSKKK